VIVTGVLAGNDLRKYIASGGHDAQGLPGYGDRFGTWLGDRLYPDANSSPVVLASRRPCPPELQFPGVSPRQALHDPTSPQYKQGKTPMDPRALPAGKSVEDALREGWENPVAGDPRTGQIFGKVSFPVNGNGDRWLDLRVSGKGVHGWPTSGPK